MATLLAPLSTLDVLGLDRQGSEDRLRNLYSQMNPDWVDFTSNFPENLILSGQAFLSSLIGEAGNEKIRQLFWPLVTDRLACIRLGRGNGFSLTGRAAATVDVIFRLPNNTAAANHLTLA